MASSKDRFPPHRITGFNAGRPRRCLACGEVTESAGPCGGGDLPGILTIDWLWARKVFGPHWQARLYGRQITAPGF